MASSDSDSESQGASAINAKDLEALLEDDDDDSDNGRDDDVNAILGGDTDSGPDSGDDPATPKAQQELPVSSMRFNVESTVSNDTLSANNFSGSSTYAPDDSIQKISQSMSNVNISQGQRLPVPADVFKYSTNSSNSINNAGILHAGANNSRTSIVGINSGKDTQFGALDMAERREQRYFQAGQREIPTALKFKRGKRSGGHLVDVAGVANRGGLTGTSAAQLGAESSSLKVNDMEKITAQLKRNASYKQHGPGTATAVHVNPKFFVVGTSNGLLLVFDFYQDIRQVIGSASAIGTRCDKAITALDMTPSGNMIVCGYVTGELALWDANKGIVLKRVTDLHRRRITQLQFIRGVGESIDTRDASTSFWTVSADTGGNVHRGLWSKSLWSNYGADFDCLIDGSAGAVPTLHVLTPIAEWNLDRTGSRANDTSTKDATVKRDMPLTEPLTVPPHMHDVQMLAFDTLTRSYIVQIQPVIRVLHRWPAPPMAEGSERERVSCLHWSWSTVRHYPSMAGRVPYATQPKMAAPVLARAWGNTVEVLWAVAVPGATANDLSFSFELVATSCHTASVLSVRWLDEDRLVVLTQRTVSVVNQHLVVLECCQLTPHVATSIQAAATALHAGKVEDSAMSSLFSRERFVYVLGPESMLRLHLQSWVEQAEQLVQDGRWLEALALALDEGGQGSTAGRAQQIAGFVLRYAELALLQGGKTSLATTAHLQSHYQLVSSVCLEYCFACANLQLLFGGVYDVFVKARLQLHFLELLEPYILQGELRALPTSMLVDFFEVLAKHQRMSTLERCAVQLTIAPSDFDYVASFLLKRGAYSGFLSVWTRGQGDHVGAFQVLYACIALHENKNARAVSPTNVSPTMTNVLAPEQIEIGYKLLLFLHYTAQGKAFPQGTPELTGLGTTPTSPTSTAKSASSRALSALLRLLLSTHHQPLPSERASTVPRCYAVVQPAMDGFGRALGAASADTSLLYPYLRFFCRMDLPALLSSVIAAFEALTEVQETEQAELLSTVHTVCTMLDAEAVSCSASTSQTPLQSMHVTAFYDASAAILPRCSAALPWSLIQGYVQYADKARNRATAERGVAEVVAAQLKTAASTGQVLQQLQQCLHTHNFWNAALQVSQKIPRDTTTTISSVPLFSQALTYYLSHCKTLAAYGTKGQTALDELKVYIFEFITLQMDALTTDDVPPDAPQHVDLCKVLISNILALARLDSECTAGVVQAHLLGHLSAVIEATRINPQLQLQLLRKAVTAVDSDSSKDLRDYLSPTDMLVYVRLLCTHSPKGVLPFLMLHQHYDLSACIAVCKERHLPDATALLLERSGQPAQALALLLAELSNQLRAAESELSGPAEVRKDLLLLLAKSGEDRIHALQALSQFAPIRHIVDCITGTCTRSTRKSNVTGNIALEQDVGEADVEKVEADDRLRETKMDQAAVNTELWFVALDHCIREKHSYRARNVPAAEVVTLIVVQLLQALLSAMLVEVPARVIVRHITSGANNGADRIDSGRFGDFRDIFVNMLRSYSDEMQVLHTTQDTQYDDLHKLNCRKVLECSRGVRVQAKGGALLPRGGGQSRITVLQPPDWCAGASKAQIVDASTIRVGSNSRLSRHPMRRALQGSYSKVRARGMGDMRWAVTSFLDLTPPPFLPDLTDDTTVVDRKARYPGTLPREAASTAEFDP